MIITKLIRNIRLYFEGKAIWDAKMSEPLYPRVISTPDDTKYERIDRGYEKERATDERRT